VNAKGLRDSAREAKDHRGPAGRDQAQTPNTFITSMPRGSIEFSVRDFN
jgi:hypothetical protein